MSLCSRGQDVDKEWDLQIWSSLTFPCFLQSSAHKIYRLRFPTAVLFYFPDEIHFNFEQSSSLFVGYEKIHFWTFPVWLKNIRNGGISLLLLFSIIDHQLQTSCWSLHAPVSSLIQLLRSNVFGIPTFFLLICQFLFHISLFYISSDVHFER